MDSPLRPSDRPTWATLPCGTVIDIVKLDPSGTEITRYPGRIVESVDPDEWIVAEASWTRPSLEIEGLIFATGDRLLEYFSPVHPFDAFAVFSPDGVLRGWYANVTWPSWMDLDADLPVLFWHDLYIDLIGLPHGRFTILDEDELAAARVTEELRSMIETARDQLIHRFQSRQTPFIDK